MRFSTVFVFGVQVSSIVALPARSIRRSQVNPVSQPLLTRNVGVDSVAALKKLSGGAPNEEENIEEGKASNESAGGCTTQPWAELEAEKEIPGVFGTAVALEGGDIKQETVFTSSAIGAFEYEFQGSTADQLTVTENKTPAAPPAGYVAVEPSSFQVALGTSKGTKLTLSKIDYIFDAKNLALAAMDLTKARVGKLCAVTGSFIIEEALGELEFEAEENEVTLKLNKAVTAEGEWGIFLPVAEAGAALGEAQGGEGEVEGEGPGGEGRGGEQQAAPGRVAEMLALMELLRQEGTLVPAVAVHARS